MTHETPKVSDAVLWPVSDHEMTTLRNNVQVLYEESATSESYFTVQYGDENEQGRLVPVARRTIPTIQEWLGEFSEIRRNGYGWMEYTVVVFSMVENVVRGAYLRRFGDQWEDDKSLVGDADDTVYSLYSWIKGRLKDVTNQNNSEQIESSSVDGTQ